MKTFSRSALTKTCAALLCFVLLLAFIVESVAIAFLCMADAYSMTEEDYYRTFYRPIAYSYGLISLREQLMLADSPLTDDILRHKVDNLTYDVGRFSSFYDISLVDCKLFVFEPESTITLPPAPTDGLYTMTIDIDRLGRSRVGDTSDPLRAYDPEQSHAVMIVTLRDCEVRDIASLGILAVRVAWEMRYAIYAVALVNLVLIILLWVYLCSVAGLRPGDDTVHLRLPARIPLDIELAVLIAAAVAALALLPGMTDDPVAWPLGVVLIAICGLVGAVVVEWLPISLAARLKVRGWWRNTLIIFVLLLTRRAARAVWRGCAKLWRFLPFMWRTVIFVLAAFIIEVFLALTELFFPLWCFNVLLAAAAIWYAVSVVRLKNRASALAAGDIRERPVGSSKYMPHELSELGKTIDNIGCGLSRAVEEKTRSERMKTELITNVSHDIKTPLTSIVNYVELLSRETLDGKAAEYVEVLGRQSGRMKKLIDDLIEASKAASGSIESHPAPLDLSVMAGQTGGEYAERLAERGLRLVVSGADEPAMVTADGRLVWRIWDNLLGNICKYAMPGTRVYIDIERRGAMMATVFRNISERPLTKCGGELTERFVRGDDSRSGEGSGLGLSIAAGLAAVQGGSLTVTADGDLFKAEVLLPAISSEALKSTPPAQRQPAPAPAPAYSPAPAPASDPAPAADPDSAELAYPPADEQPSEDE